MICAAVLALQLTSPGVEPERVEVCFEKAKSCQVFQQLVLPVLNDLSKGKVKVRSTCEVKR